MEAAYHAGDPVATTAPSLLEVVRGWSAIGERGRNSLLFLLGTIAGGAITVLPLGVEAAILAGRLRAHRPRMPPARRGDHRSRAERQAAWQMDILIAASAYAAGYDIATADQGHFGELASLIGELAPGGPPLAVVRAPAARSS